MTDEQLGVAHTLGMTLTSSVGPCELAAKGAEAILLEYHGENDA